MTTATITNKLNTLKARAQRLASFGELDDSTVSMIDSSIGGVERQLDQLDRHLTEKLGIVENIALRQLSLAL